MKESSSTLRCLLIILTTFLPSFLSFLVLSSAIGSLYSIPPLSPLLPPPLPSSSCIGSPLSLSHPLLFAVTLTAVDAGVTHVEATLLGAHLLLLIYLFIYFFGESSCSSFSPSRPQAHAELEDCSALRSRDQER